VLREGFFGLLSMASPSYGHLSRGFGSGSATRIVFFFCAVLSFSACELAMLRLR